ADGYHSRVDGLTSLGVLFSAVGVWLGYPLTDPIIGLVITVAILPIVWESGKAVFTRLLDGVDPEVTDEITHALKHAQGVHDVTEIRLRWSGHRLYAEVNVAVSPKLSVAEAHAIAMEARHQLLHHLPYLSKVTIHIDPENLSGEEHHRIIEHTHEGLATHSHR
ncbi:MAG TPA: cation diffusion facilitator family transporter, partial [Nitrososphaera sp.]|nr:cation diffusion facilitator family transporter [Nitrososphaera sp.]